MSESAFSHEELLRDAKFKPEDIAEIHQRRRDNNRLGFAYQLAFVRLTNRLPAQQPLEILDELLTYVAVQLDIPGPAIAEYQQRRQTIVEHGGAVVDYLGLRSFGEGEIQADIYGRFREVP
ncbi:MAG: DUF4158 domain-containing protein [Anaerolineae bacterium]|nr:DUF4158 domain-containing protein [Anaerolineales bacterium]MCB8936426.1 DUF4158 domain-containing protein [Promineifilum sp.]MCO5182169.1 DUF4158 domain-containing protein [Promineifilum sp.]MCW5848094.1 DUF4158 domain-containing protein [Anaerolineae bacterium]